MPITFGTAKKLLSKYVGSGGKCPSSSDADLFTIKTLQRLLYSGTYGSTRKFTFNAVHGVITAPFELETPLKVKVDGKVGTVWNRWFEYYSTGDLQNCRPAQDALFEEPNESPVIYDLPTCGSRICTVGTCDEAADAHLIIQGKDATGRQVYTYHQGEQVSGEVVRICKGQQICTNTVFATVEHVIKTRTNGYVQLFGMNSQTGVSRFLADYSPVEENPSYRRFRVDSRYCPHMYAKISVLGRIRLRNSYTDNDIIPFDNLFAIETAGQEINKSYNDDYQGTQAKAVQLQGLITQENDFKRPNNGQPIEAYPPLSPGAIKNIV